MKGDFSRFSHQPDRHYAAVLTQQGRVTLDADWNEQLHIEDHRWRVQTVDTIGRACAPIGNDGFELTLTPDRSDLIIKPGRIYVEGILIELDAAPRIAVVRFGRRAGGQLLVEAESGDWLLASEDWVEVGSESWPAESAVTQLVGTEEDGTLVMRETGGVANHLNASGAYVRRLTTYRTQPYFPANSTPPVGDGFDPSQCLGEHLLAYLMVWRRHVTAVEDPHIREKALGGPDTATRLQTVWAVRLLREKADAHPLDVDEDCTANIGLWDEVVAPSGGRMSAWAEAAPLPDDDCKVAPDAGYRGLENRLYRVEIHDPGPLGTATFKWSADNASLLSSIESFDATDPKKIKVRSLGRDEMLRFSAGDRVEVLSDETELSLNPGVMAEVVGDPDREERTMVLSVGVKSAFAGHTNPRVRLWHQPSDPIVTTSATIPLELGVEVSFSGDDFQTGDYWVIPARVATGDVEGFAHAPPRGIRRHYARIGVVTWPDDESGWVKDCRRLFPPLCALDAGCATVTVGDGTHSTGDYNDIQEAVDSLPLEGPAQLSILPGEYHLGERVLVRRSDLTIIGCGRQTRIFAAPDEPAFDVAHSSRVRIEALGVSADTADGAIIGTEVVHFTVAECSVVNAEQHDGGGDNGGAPFVTANDERWEEVRNRLEREELIRLIERPRVASPVPVGPAVNVSRGVSVTVAMNELRGVPAVSVRGTALDVRSNRMTGGGVWIREGSRGARIAANTIEDGLGAGVALGNLGLAELHDTRSAGVFDVEILGNVIEGMDQSGVSTVVLRRDENNFKDIETVIALARTGAGAVATTAMRPMVDAPHLISDMTTVSAAAYAAEVDWYSARYELPRFSDVRELRLPTDDAPAVAIGDEVPELAAGPVAFVNIAGNKITGCACSSAHSLLEPEGVGGVVLRDVAGVRIHDNEIVGNGQRIQTLGGGRICPGLRACGVFLAGCDMVEISDNTVLANGNRESRVDLNFSGVAVGTHEGPLDLGEFHFEGDDLAVVQLPPLSIRGLTFQGPLEIQLPEAANRAEVIVFSEGGAIVDGLDEDGNAVVSVGDAPGQSRVRYVLTGPDFTRLRISADDAAMLVALCVGSGCRTYQAGIAVLSAASGTSGRPAARVHDNVVVAPRGQALLVTGAGQMSISDNALTSLGVAYQPVTAGLALEGQEEFATGPASVAAVLINLLRPVTAYIWNVGEAPLAGGLGAMVASNARARSVRISNPTAEVYEYSLAAHTTGISLPEGRTMVHGNQITFQPDTADVAFPISVGIASMDDVAVDGNQIDVEAPSSPVLNTIAFALMARAGGNRWQEPLKPPVGEGDAGTLASYLGLGLFFSQAIGNQAIHCVVPFAWLNTVDQGNQELIDVVGLGDCPEMKQTSIRPEAASVGYAAMAGE